MQYLGFKVKQIIENISFSLYVEIFVIIVV